MSELTLPSEVVVPSEVIEALADNGCCPNHDVKIRRQTLDDAIKMVKAHSEDDKLMNDYYVELLEQMKGGEE